MTREDADLQRPPCWLRTTEAKLATRLADSRSARRIGRATAGQSVLAGRLSAGVAVAAFAGAKRTGAPIFSLTRSWCTRVTLDAADQPVIAGAFHPSSAIAPLAGTEGAGAGVLRLAGAGSTGISL